MRHQKNLVFSEKLINVCTSLVKTTRTLFVRWCPQTDMPSERRRNLRSKIRWFTKFCNSHYLSHFAAFFIDARAKRSVVESLFKLLSLKILFVFLIQIHERVWLNTRVRAPKRPLPTFIIVLMILPQVHLRKPCYDFYFL